MEDLQKGIYQPTTSAKVTNVKLLNILIYSENQKAGNKVETCLKDILDCDRYTVYSVSQDTLKSGAWKGRTALIVMVGDLDQSSLLLIKEHLFEGGRLLALHSNFLHSLLPYCKNNIREELVPVTYDKWTVKLKHQILSFDKEITSTDKFLIQVVASESSYNTPSLIKVNTNHGVAMFSQIHLETDPTEYLGDDGIKSNEARLEILCSVLGDLGLHIKQQENIAVDYTIGYFIGNNESKIALIKDWCSDKQCHKIEDLNIKYYHKGETPLETPSKSFLPIYIDENPENFSTEDYFNNLTSAHLGHLVLYSDVVSSTMNIIKDYLAHGIAVISRRQLLGRGRGGNNWITPSGQAAISLQVCLKVSPILPLLQHVAALAAVLAIRRKSYKNLDIRIKWPNDIYYGREVKIGGVVTTANCIGEDVFVNIGTGVNISNSVPTTCVNDIIIEYNKKHRTDLPKISIESFLARYCSELEVILDNLNTSNGIENFLDQYYQYWLHSGEQIRIRTKEDFNLVLGTIAGVDFDGWLRVQTPRGEITVAPDGNTFDMMNGLVAPKF